MSAIGDRTHKIITRVWLSGRFSRRIRQSNELNGATKQVIQNENDRWIAKQTPNTVRHRQSIDRFSIFPKIIPGISSVEVE